MKRRARARSSALAAELRQLGRDPLLLLVSSVVALSFLDGYVWVGALLRELGFPLGLAALALALFFLARRKLARTVLLFACAALLARGAFPYLRARRPTPQHGPTLTIAQAHLEHAHLRGGEVARYLAMSGVDVLSLTALTEPDARRLAGFAVPQHMGFAFPDGRMLWVKRALAPTTRSGAQIVRVGRCQLAIVQVDLPSLFAVSTLSERRQRIAQLRKASKEPRRVYLGHFGSGSDSADLAQLKDDQELRDARLGYGRKATAPAWLGPIFGLPLDHVLLQGWLLSRSVASTPALVPGAHRTLHATLELTEPRCAPRAAARP